MLYFIMLNSFVVMISLTLLKKIHFMLCNGFLLGLDRLGPARRFTGSSSTRAKNF
jgi:hypothetical protein